MFYCRLRYDPHVLVYDFFINDTLYICCQTVHHQFFLPSFFQRQKFLQFLLDERMTCNFTSL